MHVANVFNSFQSSERRAWVCFVNGYILYSIESEFQIVVIKIECTCIEFYVIRQVHNVNFDAIVKYITTRVISLYLEIKPY